MRFIGSKVNLLREIDETVNSIRGSAKTFCDLFSGTASVAKFFKKSFSILSNDLLYFSYALQRATVMTQETPRFDRLRSYLGLDPFSYFSELDLECFEFKRVPFIFENYSPTKDNSRQYFSNENALRIDAFRQLTDEWYDSEMITEDEYFYLIAGIVEAVPSVSNIAGTYGAYLKHWDKRTQKTLTPSALPVFDNGMENVCFNRNANDLIREIKGDILYLDPPYNGRQYISNYHILETVARYDSPEISGVTGTRVSPEGSSDYCKKGKVYDAFEDLIANANFKHIIISYSNEGILSEDSIVEMLKNHGNPKTLSVKRIPYRRYKRLSSQCGNDLYEFIFSIQK